MVKPFDPVTDAEVIAKAPFLKLSIPPTHEFPAREVAVPRELAEEYLNMMFGEWSAGAHMVEEDFVLMFIFLEKAREYVNAERRKSRAWLIES